MTIILLLHRHFPLTKLHTHVIVNHFHVNSLQLFVLHLDSGANIQIHIFNCQTHFITTESQSQNFWNEHTIFNRKACILALCPLYCLIVPHSSTWLTKKLNILLLASCHIQTKIYRIPSTYQAHYSALEI